MGRGPHRYENDTMWSLLIYILKGPELGAGPHTFKQTLPPLHEPSGVRNNNEYYVVLVKHGHERT